MLQGKRTLTRNIGIDENVCDAKKYDEKSAASVKHEKQGLFADGMTERDLAKKKKKKKKKNLKRENAACLKMMGEQDWC